LKKQAAQVSTMNSSKPKLSNNEQEASPLRNGFTFHLMLYLGCVVLTFWDMLGWEYYPLTAVQDRMVLFAIWGVMLMGHYVYLRYSSALAHLQTTVQYQRKALSEALFTQNEVLVDEERAKRLQK
jgi:hypothetical protein